MDRGSELAWQTEVVKSANRPVHLVSVETSGSTLYLTDAAVDISYSGNTYLRVGRFLSFSDIEEDSTPIINSVTISLSAVDQTSISSFLNDNYIDRQVNIYLGFFNDSNQFVVDPVLIFDGRIDSPQVNENPNDGTSVMAVTATNSWVDFTRKTGRRANHEEQQIHFSGDMGFEYASEIIRNIPWGRTG